MIALPALSRWLLVQASLWAPLLGLAAWRIAAEGSLADWMLWGLLVALGGSFVLLWRLLRSGRTLADRATGLRVAGLLAAGAGYVLRGEVGWALWAAFVVVVLGDLLDGWLARRFGGSDEGAVLDMEADQLVLMTLALLAALAGAGVWTLVVPGLRYGFVLAMAVLGIPFHDPKPCDGDNRRGKVLCALVTVLLLAALLPAEIGWARTAAGLAAVVLLLASYAGDVSYLWRKRAASRSTR